MFVLFLLALALPLRAQNEILRWRPAAALATARSNACAVRMADGRVLVTGGTGNDGPTNSAELFHAAPEEKFEAVAPMLAPRTGHACVLLGDGRVLVAGGESSGAPAAEVYDPTIQEWIGVASTLPANRGAGLTATLLPDGRVLLVGGALAGIEAYDPDTGELQVLTVRLTAPRQGHTATLLADGRVLLAGGMVDGKSVGIAEIFDAATSTLTATASLAGERSSHTATLLSDTRVLIAGGSAGSEERAELEVFLPGRDAFETLEAKLEHPRQGHIAVPLETNGAVLIAGGSGAGQPLSTTEIFEPWDNRIVAAGELTAPRVALAGVALEDGGVLALGGRNADGASRSCGVLTPGIALRFTQTRYRPLEVAVIQGSVGTTLPAPVTMALSLQRVNLTTGVTVAANDRLLVQSITIPVSGNLPQTAVMNVVRDDIGHDFVLRAGRETAVQARFGVRLTTALTLSPALPVIAGSPARMRLTLTADGAPVNMSGTRTAVVGARSAATITLSDLAASSISEFSICCETAPGVVQTSGRYSGNVFLEPSSVAGTIIIGNPAPAVRIAPAALRLQEPGQILVEVQFDAASIDPNAPPRGTLALSKNGTVIATAPLANNLVLDSGIPRGALFPFTPSAADRRTTPCFMVEYAGDSRYTAIRSPITCLSVGPAATGLQVSIGTSTVYTLGENRTVTARLTWPDSVGIVGRTVNVTAGGQSVAAITLTPDPTGRGIATGSASVRLPFQTAAVVFTYPQSGDLSLASNTIRTTMAPVSTTMLINVPSPTANPFTVRYTLRLNTGGVSLPPGTNVGGSVQILDGTEVLATQTLAPLPGISDGTSNTITFDAPTIPGLLTNVIRPLGQRSIRVRFTGSPLFAASEATAVVTVQ